MSDQYLEKLKREQALRLSNFDRAKVQLRINEVVDLARSKFGVSLVLKPTSYKLKGRAAAQAKCQSTKKFGDPDGKWTFTLNINKEAYHADPEDMLKHTIPHEVAHMVCHENGTDGGHGSAWLRADLALGGNGKRTHDIKLTPIRKVKKFLYRNPNGDEVNFKQGRHSNLKLGKTLYYETKDGRRWTKADFIGEVE